MKIRLIDVGKRYNREWIFRKVNYEFKPDGYAILGANGSGKSTLLQVIAGNLLSSEGEITYQLDDNTIEEEKIFRHLSFASPYLDLPEEMTLTEIFDFQSKFKPFFPDVNKANIRQLLELEKKTAGKPVKYYSSGMKQRLKLGLAMLSDNALLLLDEPITNLDQQGVKWYRKMIENYKNNRIVIVCSNQMEQEYFFCEEKINMEDFK